MHKYSIALRLGTIGAGNDHRLGANEAPPAIISVFLGEQLTDVIDSIIEGKTARSRKKPVMEIGVSSLPPLPVGLSDRNRTSPFAFTGNKFEFRAVGSSQSIAPVNIALNAAVACALDDIATQLEAAVSAGTPLNQALQEFLPREFKEHSPVVFNGNGYSNTWPKEAERRGLPNLSKGVTVSKTSILIFDFAKILRQNGADMGGKRFFAWLRENGYLVKRKGSDYNMPTQRSMELGLFEIKETVITHSDGHTTISRTPKITGKGQVYFFNKILGTDMPEDMQG